MQNKSIEVVFRYMPLFFPPLVCFVARLWDKTFFSKLRVNSLALGLYPLKILVTFTVNLYMLLNRKPSVVEYISQISYNVKF